LSINQHLLKLNCVYFSFFISNTCWIYICFFSAVCSFLFPYKDHKKKKCQKLVAFIRYYANPEGNTRVLELWVKNSRHLQIEMFLCINNILNYSINPSLFPRSIINTLKLLCNQVTILCQNQKSPFWSPSQYLLTLIIGEQIPKLHMWRGVYFCYEAHHTQNNEMRYWKSHTITSAPRCSEPCEKSSAKYHKIPISPNWTTVYIHF